MPHKRINLSSGRTGMLPEPSGREAAAPRRRFSGSWESLGTLGDLGPKLRMDGGEIIAEMHAQYYATPKVGARPVA